jgi:hypothetical protein
VETFKSFGGDERFVNIWRLLHFKKVEKIKTNEEGKGDDGSVDIT